MTIKKYLIINSVNLIIQIKSTKFVRYGKVCDFKSRIFYIYSIKNGANGDDTCLF